MHHKINKILCPTDFSSAANSGITYAAHLARYFNASLVLWNMFEVSLKDEAASFVGLPNSIGEQQDHVNMLMESCIKEIEKEFLVPCSFSSEKSKMNLEATMKHYLGGKHYDLVIMGTNGADNLYQYFFGSHSYQVSNWVGCPVLIVPEFYEYQNMSSLVFLTDYGPEDIKYLSTLEYLYSIPIHIIHLDNEKTETSQKILNEFKENVIDELKNKDSLSFSLIAHHELRENIDEVKAGMIVVTSSKRNAFEKLIHTSFSKTILDFPDYPIMVFPT